MNDSENTNPSDLWDAAQALPRESCMPCTLLCSLSSAELSWCFPESHPQQTGDAVGKLPQNPHTPPWRHVGALPPGFTGTK